MNSRVEELRQASWEELRDVFAASAPPRAEEMHGEYRSTLPASIDAEWRQQMRDIGRGEWHGKAYIPDKFEGNVGQGYNIYSRNGVEIRLSRFIWNFAPSILDGRMSLLMHYSRFDNWGAKFDLTDEIRAVGEGAYLGLAHGNREVEHFLGELQENGRTKPGFFLLDGPFAVAKTADEE